MIRNEALEALVEWAAARAAQEHPMGAMLLIAIGEQNNRAHGARYK